MSNEEAVLGIIVFGVLALIGVLVVGAIGGAVMSMGVTHGSEEIVDPEASQTYEIDENVDEPPPVLEVRATQGNAIFLSGSGYVDGGSPVGWGDDDWAVCTTVQLGDGEEANTNATYNVFAHDNESILVEFADGDWRALHYSGGESAESSVPASDPTALTSVCASWDDLEEELTLIENGENSDSASLTSASPDRRVANNWYGTIDEIRLIDGAITQAEAEEYAQDPVNPLVGSEHSARYMFNEGGGESSHVYYANQTATIVDGDWTEGVQDPGLDEGDDYVLSYDPLEITIVSDGYLDGAPTVFVNWDTGFGALMGSLITGTGDALRLVPIVLILLMLGLIVGVVQRMG